MRWTPIENNPTVLNKYIKMLGVDDGFEFVDVYGVSKDLLAMLPRPVEAFLFVFPISKEIEKLSRTQAAECKEEAKKISKENGIQFLIQKVENACGTIAIGHALLNNWNIKCSSGSLADLLRQYEEGNDSDDANASSKDSLDEMEKSTAKGENLLSMTEEFHKCAAQEGSSAIDSLTNLHFVCYLLKGGKCVEFDGRQENIILHDDAKNEEEFVLAAAKAMKEKMNMSPDSIEFSITALVKTG